MKHTWFNRDGGDGLDSLGRGVQVDDALMNAHFESIPSVGTFSGRSLTGSDAQLASRKAHRSRNVQFLVQSGLLQDVTDLLQVGNISRSQSDADAVDNLVFSDGIGFLFHRRGVRHGFDWNLSSGNSTDFRLKQMKHRVVSKGALQTFFVAFVRHGGYIPGAK